MIREHRAALLAALAAAVIGGALEYRLAHPATAPMAQAQPPDALPVLDLRAMDGRPVRLPDAYPRRALLLNFWASWCAACVREMGELQAYAEQQPANGVQVVGIALDDPQAVSAFLRSHPVSYPILLDRPGVDDSSARMGNRAGMLPYSVLVAADGRVLKQQWGPFTAGEIEAWAGTGTTQP